MSDQSDKIRVSDSFDAWVARKAELGDGMLTHGVFEAVCYDSEGNEKWRDTFPNTVVTVGKNALLDAGLAGSAYTVTGPFMGLISSDTFSAINAADTMSSHAGWKEAGNAFAPTYTSPRKTCVWSAASGGVKALSASLTFAILTSGTAKGGFITFGTGAVSTIDSTAGTLFSAGLFTGGDKVVSNGDTLSISYSVTLT